MLKLSWCFFVRRLFGVDIDTEWRSDWKWDRIEPHLGVSLEGKVVADIGCANGYFMFRMLEVFYSCSLVNKFDFPRSNVVCVCV